MINILCSLFMVYLKSLSAPQTHVASNASMIKDTEFERVWMEAVTSNLRCYPCTCLQGLINATINVKMLKNLRIPL
jgi:hypothetical protein